MRVLIIHHLEPMWEHGYRKQGTSFMDMCEKVISHIKHARYDKVILTQFEDWDAQDEHYEAGIVPFVDQWEEYAYGWERSCEGENGVEGVDWVEGGQHSQIVMLADWMKELKGHKVSICGAFDGECIEDLEIALNGCGVKFRRIEKLIV